MTMGLVEECLCNLPFIPVGEGPAFTETLESEQGVQMWLILSERLVGRHRLVTPLRVPFNLTTKTASEFQILTSHTLDVLLSEPRHEPPRP